MQTSFSIDSGSSFSALLARYMNGQIAERSWKKLMKTFDLAGVSSLERMAFARFMNEILADGDTDQLNVPKPAEMEELLSETRVSRK